MRFKEFGSKNNKTIIFIHGYGITWKMWKVQIEAFRHSYHVVVPILDGHDEESRSSFISVENSAEQIIQYIEENCEGRVYAICGSSLGGTIAAHILAKKQDITKKAIIDAGPIVKSSKAWVKLSLRVRLLQRYQLRKGGLVMKALLKRTYMPKPLIDECFKLFSYLSKETVRNAIVSSFNYKIPDSMKQTEADVVYWYGSKEAFIAEKSADYLVKLIPNTKVEVFKKYEHGELCMGNPKVYIEKATKFLNSEYMITI